MAPVAVNVSAPDPEIVAAGAAIEPVPVTE